MKKVDNNTLEFIRSLMVEQNVRPAEALLFTDPLYPDNDTLYSVSLTDTTIGIVTSGQDPYTVTYEGKSLRQVAIELNDSPTSIQVKALTDVGNLKSGDLIVKGTGIPGSFDREDRSFDGKGCIVRVKRWGISFNKLTSISLRAPYSSEVGHPWWGRIQVGKFTHRDNGITYFFDVPEYYEQTWSPFFGAPFVDVEGERANLRSATQIKTARAPLNRNTPVVITTEDQSRQMSSDIIEDIDYINGYIYLKQGVNVPPNAKIYYTYLEKSLLYKEVNLNGHFAQNPFVLDKYVLFYALPVRDSKGGSRSRGIYHVVSDSIPGAINLIDNASSSEPVAIIGAISVKQSIREENISITDTRSYGGGLRDDAVGEAAQKRFPESQYFNDISQADGIPYPGNGAVVVELPDDLREVLSIAEIRQRAKKYLAAGVYPLYAFKENIAGPGEHAADISMMQYDFEFADSMSGQAGWWVNTNLTLPDTDSIYSGYTTGNFKPNPIYDQGNNKIVLSHGEVYQQSFIRGSVNPEFSWEERSINSEWKKKTWVDSREVATGLITAGTLQISSEYGTKEVRNITGFAPYRLDEKTKLYSDVAQAAAQILENIEDLSSDSVYADITGSVSNVIKAEAEYKTENDLGVSDLYEPGFIYYKALHDKNFSRARDIWSRNVKLFHDSISGDWPRIYNESEGFKEHPSTAYNAVRDIYIYSKYASQRMDLLATATGAATVYNDNDIALAHSGAWGLATKIEGLANGQGVGLQGHVREPYYIPASGTSVAILTGGTLGESDPSVNTRYLNTEYIPAYAALYATQVAPVASYYTGSATGLVHDYSVVPSVVAMSGIAMATVFLEQQITQPYYNMVSGSNTWLTRFNRISELASRSLKNCTEAYDLMYYGNKEWAGYTGYSTKFGPLSSYGQEFEYDRAGEEIIVWGDGTDHTWSASFRKSIAELDKNFNVVGDYMLEQVRHGGILEPGYIDAVRSFTWLPLHYAKQDTLFYPDYSGSAAANIERFEKFASAILRGSLSHDGILKEGGSFKLEPAPFSGSVPSKLMEMAAEAIEYYKTTKESDKEDRWHAIAQGLVNTTERLYAFDGGYPSDTVFNSNLPVAGDPGSKPLKGYFAILSQKQDAFTDAEILNITGGLGGKF